MSGRRILRLVTWLSGGFIVLFVALVATVELRWTRTYAAPYPNIRSTSQPGLIARGEYLVRGAGHCASCHTPNEQGPRLARGEVLPLIGGHVWNLPFGRIASPNITPDTETGIGRRTDQEIARVLRHGVRSDGRAALPFMEFHDLSDDDLAAVIAYLRSQPPVRHAVPDHEPNLLGKALLSFVMTPVGPSAPPPSTSPAVAPTLERGRYLALGVAGCVECHTKRNPRDGSYVGPRFAGGMEMHSDAGQTLITPNLTPHPTAGHIYRWNEDAFVARFKLGPVAAGSPMPWSAYQRMAEADVRAVYRYLRSLPPAAPEPAVAQTAR